MRKNIDIKNGVFSVYGTGETLSFIEGKIERFYTRKGQTNQIQVIVKGDEEYCLNIYVSTSYIEDLCNQLLRYSGEVVKITLLERNGFKNLHLIK